ncbi:MAG: hypothetical protein K2X46_07960, partial [Roseomonas sp.]|nr:hypothetical protein [Roseomonas sp.]
RDLPETCRGGGPDDRPGSGRGLTRAVTEEREQASRGLGGRAALEAYRAARVAQRDDLRAALRANREALRAARILPPAKKASEAAAMADAPAPPVMEAERALAPPEPPPPTVAEAPLPVEDDTVPAEEPMVAESPIADEPSVTDPIVAAPVVAAPVVAEPVVAEPVVDEQVVDEPVVDEPVVAQPIAVEAAIDLVAVATTELVAEAAMPRAATDLSAIRELGPGMRHRLAQIGYRSCEDLAEADPARLAQQLGEVSRLLRPESWIAAARAAIG